MWVVLFSVVHSFALPLIACLRFIPFGLPHAPHHRKAFERPWHQKVTLIPADGIELVNQMLSRSHLNWSNHSFRRNCCTQRLL